MEVDQRNENKKFVIEQPTKVSIWNEKWNNFTNEMKVTQQNSTEKKKHRVKSIVNEKKKRTQITRTHEEKAQLKWNGTIPIWTERKK